VTEELNSASVGTAAPPSRVSAMIFTRDRTVEDVLRGCLENLVPTAEFIKGTVEMAVEQLAQRASPRLLFVDVSGSPEPVARINELAQVCEPGTGVIVLGDTNDIRLYRDLRNAGVVEYFFKPLVGSLITQAVNSALTGFVEQPSSRTSKFVFVIGVRGGVGATTLATSAAWHLAEELQRRVLLLDLDLYAGDAALQLDAVPTHALYEALERTERVDDLFLERALIPVSPRLSLLASLEPIDGSVIPSEASVLSLLEKLMSRYRYVFVDIPAGMVHSVPQMLQLPSICLLVSGATLVSARDVMRWRAILGPNTPERKTLHILNRTGSHGSLPDAEFLRVVGEPPDITIPYDRAIGIASKLGMKELEKCASLQRGLAPLYAMIAGEPARGQRSMIDRLLRRT